LEAAVVFLGWGGATRAKRGRRGWRNDRRKKRVKQGGWGIEVIKASVGSREGVSTHVGVYGKEDAIRGGNDKELEKLW